MTNPMDDDDYSSNDDQIADLKDLVIDTEIAHQQLMGVLQAFVNEMKSHLGEIPATLPAFRAASALLFKSHDEAIVSQLNEASDQLFASLINIALDKGYSGEDHGLLVDVLNESFPDTPISVFDEGDPNQVTAQSVHKLELWCDSALALKKQGSEFAMRELRRTFPTIDFQDVDRALFDGEVGKWVTVTVENMSITNPFTSCCGRFDVDPEATYDIPHEAAMMMVSINQNRRRTTAG